MFFPTDAGSNVYVIIISSVGGTLLLLCLLTVCKKAIDKERYNRQRQRRTFSGSTTRSCDQVDASDLPPSTPIGSDSEALPPQSSLSNLDERNLPNPDEIVSSQDRMRESPTLSVDIIPPSSLPNDAATPPPQPFSAIPVPSPLDLPSHNIETEGSDLQDGTHHPVPSAPPDYDVFMEVDRDDFVPSDSPQELRTGSVVIPPSTIDLPPSRIPSAPPEYDVFMEIDRNEFVLEERTPDESGTEDVNTTSSSSDTEQTLSSLAAVQPTAPPLRDPPPEYLEFIENPNQYGFVTETESHSTPPPDYQPPLEPVFDTVGTTEV